MNFRSEEAGKLIVDKVEGEAFIFHHIGYCVPSLKQAARDLVMFGFCLKGGVVKDHMRRVEIQLLGCSGMRFLELVAPLGTDSPISSILGRSGPMGYHVCFEVLDMDLAIDKLRQAKYKIIQKRSPAIAFAGRDVAFLYNSDLGLIELLSVN